MNQVENFDFPDLSKKSFLVVGHSETDLNPTITKCKGFTDDVAGFSISDMDQLFWITDYNVDVVIVVDKSARKKLLRVVHTAIRMVSQHILLIAESQSFVDEHNTLNIQSKYDAFLKPDTDCNGVMDAVRHADCKRQFSIALAAKELSEADLRVHPERSRCGGSFPIRNEVNINARMGTIVLAISFLLIAVAFYSC
ncbi:hypothetical protein [uncultured Tateyamaria sp.]|uniref:hypothetical protein n=1 Tax=uncultured Tateyamaria sp. TaxID=455651 RepID=UPI0026106800|nr:hypothetical protein [uncultured Tateyamaria sp.]